MLKLVKIRERSHIILWTLLFFFVLSMVVGGLVGGANIMTVIFGEGDQGGLYVGVVDDIKITRQEFLQERSNQIRRLRQQNNTIDSRAIRNAENNAWNTIVDRIIINNEAETYKITIVGTIFSVVLPIRSIPPIITAATSTISIMPYIQLGIPISEPTSS